MRKKIVKQYQGAIYAVFQNYPTVLRLKQHSIFSAMILNT